MSATRRHTARLVCEALESRELPSASPITYHHGDLQKTANVEAIYYGPSWGGDLAGLRKSINAGLKTALGGAYLGTLEEAGYGTFSDSLSGSTLTSSAAGATNGVVTPDQVEAYLTNALQNPYTADQPTDRVYSDSASRLYLVVVDPTYAVQDSQGNSSQSSVLGYHSFFRATLGGAQQIVHYAVVATPGGSAGNQAIANVITPQLDTVTAMASREIIDEMANPDGFGWYAAGSLKEVGDSGSYVDLNNTLVARSLTTDLARQTPAAASAGWDPSLGIENNAPTFLLDGSGNLTERLEQLIAPSGPGISTLPATIPINTTAIAGNVCKVSDQGIDNAGRATVSFVTGDGSAYEYHDGGRLVLLYSPGAAAGAPITAQAGVHVLDAKAGQGVSYVLLSNHEVWEYDGLSRVVSKRETGVTAIDAGTTRAGVNMVDVIDTGKVAWEVPDRGSEHSFGLSSVIQVSAGRQGVSALLKSDHTARVYDDAKGGFVGPVRLNIAQVESGFSANGNYVLDLLFLSTRLPFEVDYTVNSSGQLVEKVERNGPRTGAVTMSKMRAGVVDLIFADGAYQGTIDGPQDFLGAGYTAAV